jgi:hypothetical protein
MARARALAAAGLPANAAGPSVETPKVTRCAPIRLSLWRMASLAGEQGSRVWDVEIKVPDLFRDAGKDVKESEDLNVSTMSWSPDSRSIALTVIVRRRRVDGTFRRHNRFLVLYDMQDGKQKRVIRIPSIDRQQSSSEDIFGIEWCRLSSRKRVRAVVSTSFRIESFHLKIFVAQKYNLPFQPGSATYILKHMRELPDNTHFMEEKDTKARQRQRAFNAMRNTSRKQGEADLKLKEEMFSDSVDWSTCLLDYPRTDQLGKGAGEEVDEEAAVAVLCAWEGHRLHLFLDATIYLGSIILPEQIHSLNIVSTSGHLFLCTEATEGLTLQILETCLDPHSTRFATLQHLESLSTSAFNLLTYCYDTVVDIRNLYRNTHINCITPWFRKGKNIEMQYSTHFQTEMQMLLLTSSANEAITSLLVGNETMTEGDLNKMKTEVASAWVKMETLLDSVFQALQRLGIIYEEVKGCWLWQEHYSTFLPIAQGEVIEIILALISQSQSQSLTSLRHVQQEMRCWSQFYKWFKYERTRQEAIRDQVAEPKSDITYDVVLIADFLKRGFFNHHLEKSVGITLDKKTRGTFVENEDEEEEKNAGDAAGKEQEESALMDQSVDDRQSQTKQSDIYFQHSDLLEIQKQMRRIPDDAGRKTNSAPSEADLTSVLSSSFLLTGPSKGMHEGQHLSTKNTLDVYAATKELLELSSALFSQAFSSYALQGYNVKKVDIALDAPLTTLRSDALVSTSTKTETNSLPTSASGNLRSCFDQSTGQHWLLGAYHEGESSIITVIEHTSLLSSVRSCTLRCQGRIIDMGFYSCHEVVVLLHDDALTRMLSFQLGSIDFTSSRAPRPLPTQRCYEMRTNQAGSGALQLSLNHAKDVAATLDNEGSLIYWDFVQIGETKDEDYEMGSSVEV